MRLTNSKRLGAVLVAAAMMGVQLAPVQAAMVGTDRLLGNHQASASASTPTALLERADVRDQMISMGLDPELAKARVARLSADELQQLNQRLAQLPAGGSTVLGVILLIFIIFIITDAIGATDIFPFVHPAR